MYNSKGWKRGFSWLNLKQKVIGSETPKVEKMRDSSLASGSWNTRRLTLIGSGHAHL